MTTLDWVIVAIVAVSLAIGVFRGFVREVFSLAGWIVAGVVAALYAGDIGVLLPAAVPGPEIRWAAGFLILFLVVLLAGGLLGMLVARLVRAAGLGPSDRFLGGVFGAVRGGVFLLVGALLAGLTPLTAEPVWTGAYLTRPLATAALAVRPYLPAPIASRVRYGEPTDHRANN